MILAVAIACMSQTPSLPWVNEPKIGALGVTHRVLRSEKNGVEIGYSVFLPSDFGSSTKHYPLVIFLHGSGGNENSDAGGFSTNFSEAVAAKAYPESVILFPNGRQSGYVDRPERKEYIETFIINELIPHAEKEYRAGGTPELRMLCGFSMGGAGSVHLALSHPDKFSGVIAFGGSAGRSGTAIQLLKQNARKLRERKFRLFLGVGENDKFAQAESFRKALDEEKISHVYKVLPGVGHDLGVYYTLTEEAARFVHSGVKKGE